MEQFGAQSNELREGELYAVVTVHGKRFELRYGYYDDRDRGEPPDVIYPDLIKHPVYTDSGEPLITMMQDACRYYQGKSRRTDCKRRSRDQRPQRNSRRFGSVIPKR